ncbi:M60 family metallopeptidase [Microlunatus speluncae]|uniref:M60 family metallopeptidase n=1 Tax=Microlunatus speluncae TaxID=2594267 RepID=UPI00137615D4|nr:M60 family metallopeptidase [Microlunatus speluncae]
MSRPRTLPALLLAGACALAAGGIQVAQAHGAEQATELTITSRTAATADAERLKLAIAPGTDLQPSKLYLPPDTELSVTMSGVSDADPNGLPKIAIGAPATQVDPDATEETPWYDRVLDPRITPLKEGTTTVSDSEGGVIYLSYPAKIATPSTATVTLGDAAEPMATFTLGQTTEREFQRQLDRRPAPFVELYGERSMVTVQRSQLLLYRGENHTTLLRTLDRIIKIEDRLAGYDRGPENAGPAGPHHLVGYPGAIEGVGAYATTSFTAYPPPIQNNLLTVKGLRTAGWGPYHELGHQHQLSPVNPGDLVEVSVNIYSLAVQRAFEQYGQPPRLRAVNASGTSFWDDAMTALDQGIDTYPELNVFVKIVPFEQLRLGYGEKMITRWYDVIRQQDLPAEGDEQRWQNVVYTTSVAAGADLSDFWDTWGVTVLDETRDKITDLGLEAPTTNLTALREANA